MCSCLCFLDNLFFLKLYQKIQFFENFLIYWLYPLNKRVLFVYNILNKIHIQIIKSIFINNQKSFAYKKLSIFFQIIACISIQSTLIFPTNGDQKSVVKSDNFGRIGCWQNSAVESLRNILFVKSHILDLLVLSGRLTLHITDI